MDFNSTVLINLYFNKLSLKKDLYRYFFEEKGDLLNLC